MANDVDIKESGIGNPDKDLLKILLRDHTTKRNIIWATNEYASRGKGYGFHDTIEPELICNDDIIIPRSKKLRDVQAARVKERAEVFTPSWVCNEQNNLIDAEWFGSSNVFNTPETGKDGSHRWRPTSVPISFTGGKTWQDYVKDLRLEITCGEGPYLTSRYDSTTAEPISIEKRTGIIDRKLRIINENVAKSGDWLKAAQIAYKSSYGYEWQGDSLLIARESMLYTFIDNYKYKFGKEPQQKSIRFIAYIISWNLWQMDGLKCVIPKSCVSRSVPSQLALFEASTDSTVEKATAECPGCRTDDIRRHNGTYCIIKDWHGKGKKIRFTDMIK